jgi:hypothetical protein
MDNPEKLALLGTQDTGRRQQNKKPIKKTFKNKRATAKCWTSLYTKHRQKTQ